MNLRTERKETVWGSFDKDMYKLVELTHKEQIEEPILKVIQAILRDDNAPPALTAVTTVFKPLLDK